MGPITQIIFIYIVKHFIDSSNYILFERYSRWILYFNMLPIYPLDGGKLINLILCRFISYYKAFQITIYTSYFLFLSCFLTINLLNFNLVLFLTFFLLGITLFKEIKKSLSIVKLCCNCGVVLSDFTRTTILNEFGGKSLW